MTTNSTRRDFLATGLAAGAAASAFGARALASGEDLPPIFRAITSGNTALSVQPADGGQFPYTPVITPNGSTMPYRIGADGAKEFHIVAEKVEREFCPGMTVKCWGYNGSTPGPTIECVEGDHVRLFVTNHLNEYTSIHWHGILLPNGMDGVSGLTQPGIEPGETYVYEFTLKQHGTFMYHPHADEMTQMAYGMMGFFIIHPQEAPRSRIDRDFAIMLHNYAVHPGTYRPDPSVMLDFNMWTFNSRVYPGTDPLIVKTNDRVRFRFGNLSMFHHPIHLHGHAFRIAATDGGEIPEAGQWPETTVLVPVGSTRDVEFIADNPGDWPLHCHMSHHTMNAMAHEIANTTGVDQSGIEGALQRLLPGYMAMGQHGMGDMQDMGEMMPGPVNTLPMMMGKGQFGNIAMGGMFTLLKVRDHLDSYDRDPGGYHFPTGTMARKVQT